MFNETVGDSDPEEVEDLVAVFEQECAVQELLGDCECDDIDPERSGPQS